MEKVRKIEILNLMKEQLGDFAENKSVGICDSIQALYLKLLISYDERDYIYKFIYVNKPTPYNEYKHFTENEYWYDGIFWWKRINFAPETKQIRIDFINELIDNIK